MSDQWQARPTPTTEPAGDDNAPQRILILRLRPGERVQAVLLGDLVGRRLHYCDGTFPCGGDNCRYCDSSDPRVARAFRRWYGPGAKRGPTSWDKVIVELTDENEQALRGQDLLGLMIDLSRAATPRSHLVAQVARQKPLDDAARQRARDMAFDVRPILERLWCVGARSRSPHPTIETAAPQVLKFPRRAV